MGTVRIYKVAELLGTTSQEVTALLKRDHGIELKSASSTIEEVVARQFVERLAKQRNIQLPPVSAMFAETPVVKGKKPAPAKKAAEPPKPVAPALPPPRLVKTAKPAAAVPAAPVEEPPAPVAAPEPEVGHKPAPAAEAPRAARGAAQPTVEKHAPGAPGLAGTFDGVTFDEATAAAALGIANQATIDQLVAHGMTTTNAGRVVNGGRPYATPPSERGESPKSAASRSTLRRRRAAR